MSASAYIRSRRWLFIIASDGSKTVMPKTHAPETGARNRRFLVLVSGTCVIGISAETRTKTERQ